MFKPLTWVDLSGMGMLSWTQNTGLNLTFKKYACLFSGLAFSAST